MPSYFYHLAVELFARPHSDLRGAGAGADPHSTTSLSFDSACEALLPFQKRPRHPQNGINRYARQTSNGKRPRNSSSDHFVDTAHTAAASASTPPHLYTISPTSASDFEQDLRLDKVSIDCVDMIPSNQDTAVSNRTGWRAPRDNPVTTGIGTDILGGLRTKGKYIPLDQSTSESIWGIVHLYRDAQETPYLIEEEYPSELKGSAAAARQPFDEGASSRGSRQDALRVEEAMPDEDCTTLCILAVPSYMSPSDLLGFVGETTMNDVSHFRMIRTARANRYMVLMKFRSGKKAKDWQRDWNGKVFNSMEPETCHVVFVKTVEIQAIGSGTLSLGNSQQNALRSPHTTTASAVRTGSASTSAAPSATLSSRPLAPPTPALIELPTCPVCLERMDETTGLLTIICQHVFHCTCLQKWKGSGCPVCRYTQHDIRRTSQGMLMSPDEESTAECTVCHSDINLWVCLICGSVGCGRYDGAHAFAHYKETAHAFAMDLTTQRVWDYVGDAYVHRIIQSKTDGKLVELPAADHSALDPPDWTDAVPREKLENMSVEYTHLLTSQLESQRAYFEEVVERAVDKASQASAAACTAQDAAQTAVNSLRGLQAQYDTLTGETIPSLERDKVRAEKRAERFEAMARKLEKEWREEKTMNGSLMERIQHLSAEVEALKVANADLTEQNRDLTFFISGSERLKDQGEDVQEGTVSVPDPPSGGKKKGKGRRK
ncbi:putative RING and UBP finger domain protein [Aspergillus homomorphus CBS 101889]|uniref:Zf-UBP-domain-containing protein n=1 Tax=Aspergillus homomorphus (strain CBS 101889) TaxID=1450537 RepID=A0A395HQP5_ASPHC|nr:zf-UBP-domain-containing protein [Aspergillus homomorphus CBS 101889]RAL09753.1 zf-UBP-domain-containing protein [Aspergillus homomorphus CBS 101889]